MIPPSSGSSVIGMPASVGRFGIRDVATNSFSDHDASATSITNSGLMDGDIALGAGADIYHGEKGRVIGTISGGTGSDQIWCGTEKNIVDGGDDGDTIYGGGGADQLTGGTGADTFVFKATTDSTLASAGRDVIVDFSTWDGDKLDLHSIDANANKSGNQAFTFIASQSYHHVAGELRFQTTTTDTIVYGDVNGDGKSDFALKITGLVTLHASDFVF